MHFQVKLEIIEMQCPQTHFHHPKSLANLFSNSDAGSRTRGALGALTQWGGLWAFPGVIDTTGEKAGEHCEVFMIMQVK